jgi:hypothetical protein
MWDPIDLEMKISLQSFWSPTILCLLLALLMLFAGQVVKAEEPAWIDITVENIVVDTEGLVNASHHLTQAISGLSESINRISSDNLDLTSEQKEQLVEAIASVKQAGKAVERLAIEIPKSTQAISKDFPETLKTASQNIGDLANALPLATHNAKILANEVIDALLLKISIYLILIVTFIIVIVGLSMRILYKRWFEPLALKFESLAEAPRHLDNMARNMKETSENLKSTSTSESHYNLQRKSR